MPTSLVSPDSVVPVSPRAAWGRALASSAYRWRLALVLLLIFGWLVPTVAPFYHFIQHRPGYHLADPLLVLFPRHDVSTPLFFLMYGCSVACVGFVLRKPDLLLRGFWAYFFLQTLRMVVLYLTPLEPPAGMLLLPDPFMDNVFRAATDPITKDLFFSGHTATTTLLALAVRGRWWQRILLIAAALVGVMVLMQHVHYTYDVLAAPLFAWLAYWLAGRVWRREN